MVKNILIGIDPAFRKDGFCVCIIDEQKEVQFKTFKNGLLDFIKWLPELPDNVLIAIENSNLQKVSFDTKGSPAVQRRKSRDVGRNQAISQCVVDVCVDRFGLGKVIEVTPLMKGNKWSKATFSRVVLSEGHTLINYGRGNQDKRDAYKLALNVKQYGFYKKAKK